jgi:predicted transposase YbfD/YdcC
MDIRLLIEEVQTMTDPRRQYGNLRHKMVDIIVIALLSVLCLGQDPEDMELFGKERIVWLKTFLELPNGIPDSETFRRMLERLKPDALQECLNNWLVAVKQRIDGEITNIDGKTIRGSGNDEHKAYHVVSAWASESQITLGQVKTEEKSNEITAIPELLEMLDIEGNIVTIDAMGCQKAIVEKITEKEADYVIGLKGNQKNFHEEAKLFFEDFSDFVQQTETHDKGHGREEIREYYLESNIGWLPMRSEWANLQAIGMVKSTVFEKGAERCEIRYYAASVTDVEQFAHAVRKHWSIENQLHWCLDVVFHEDSSKTRKDNAPLNMNILRKTALSILKQVHVHRTSLRKKMYRATLDINFLERLIFSGK